MINISGSFAKLLRRTQVFSQFFPGALRVTQGNGVTGLTTGMSHRAACQYHIVWPCGPVPFAVTVSIISPSNIKVWDPHLAKDINKLENIQRRSARFVKGDDYRTTSSVTQMLQELGWQDLHSRCRDLRLALLYKAVMGCRVLSLTDCRYSLNLLIQTKIE